VHAVFFALALASTPEVWTLMQGYADSEGGACDADALAAALRAQRPNLVVHAWRPSGEGGTPSEGAMRVSLTRQEETSVLEVSAPRISFARTLPAESCGRTIATAALIVDEALDELLVSGESPPVDSLAPPVPFVKELRVSASAGAGAKQGAFGFVPDFALEAAASFRAFQLTLGVDLGLPSSTDFSLTSPESGQGTLTETTAAAELAAGAIPRLGPGWIVADAVLGLGVTVGTTSSAAVFQRRSTPSSLPFGGVRLGYALDLPRGLFVQVRAEERVGPQAGLQVVGASFPASGGQSVVTSPVWSFQTLGLLGYHFF
jgi:hypothetical protein